jgi:hypothetical protein
MKINGTILMILIFAVCIFGQSGTSKDNDNKPSTVTDKKQAKQIEKDRLERPASIQINAPKDKVIPLLVQGFTELNFAVDSDSAYRIVASRPLKGKNERMSAGMYVGGIARMYMTATINEVSGITTVILSSAIANDATLVGSRSFDKKKKNRQENDEFLEKLKIRVESQK